MKRLVVAIVVLLLPGCAHSPPSRSSAVRDATPGPAITRPAPKRAAAPAHGHETMTVVAPALYTSKSYRGTPDLGLMATLVVAGGGPSRFDSRTLFARLGGPKAKAERRRLQRMYGKAKLAAFMDTYTYSTNEMLRLFKDNHIDLPRPRLNPNDRRAVAMAVYHAGIMPNGKFDCGYMMEHLMTHPIHVVLMRDVANHGARGPGHNANFHVMLTRVVLDMKHAYST